MKKRKRKSSDMQKRKKNIHIPGFEFTRPAWTVIRDTPGLIEIFRVLHERNRLDLLKTGAGFYHVEGVFFAKYEQLGKVPKDGLHLVKEPNTNIDIGVVVLIDGAIDNVQLLQPFSSGFYGKFVESEGT
jgi:hypothetical protein